MFFGFRIASPLELKVTGGMASLAVYAPSKNIYAISEVVPDTDDRNLQQFITHSKWSAREVLDHVAHDADELIGDATDAALIIDESGFAKQGKMSVGASRQYLGRLGKVDNGQVAVFGVLAKGRFATAIDTRLYLPKKWTDDVGRCNKAGVPESERVFKTKNQLALEIVEQARRNGVRFGWVGPMRAMAVARTFSLLWLMQATPS